MLTRRDYLMRYIDKLGAYLRRRAYGQRDEGLDEEVSEALQLRLEELEDLPDAWLASRLSAAGQLDYWRALLASELALSVGELRMAEERPLAAAFLYERSARLLDLAMAGDLSAVAARLPEHVAALAGALRAAQVDDASRVSAMRQAEAIGRYDVAEDLLFDLAEHGWPDALQVGEAFFARMAALDPAQLDAGGLAPGELAPELAELRRRCAEAPAPTPDGPTPLGHQR